MQHSCATNHLVPQKAVPYGTKGPSIWMFSCMKEKRLSATMSPTSKIGLQSHILMCMKYQLQ